MIIDNIHIVNDNTYNIHIVNDNTYNIQIANGNRQHSDCKC